MSGLERYHVSNKEYIGAMVRFVAKREGLNPNDYSWYLIREESEGYTVQLTRRNNSPIEKVRLPASLEKKIASSENKEEERESDPLKWGERLMLLVAAFSAGLAIQYIFAGGS